MINHCQKPLLNNKPFSKALRGFETCVLVNKSL